MRLRHKKHLAERLTASAEFLVKPQPGETLSFSAIFGNENPVYLEVGCGKGAFALAFALKHPEYNILAVEKVDNVIVSASERAVLRQAEGACLNNLRYMNLNCERLRAILPGDSVSGIFLNFSCPYPKDSYANRRLTNRRFLKDYAEFCKEGALIEQKTDDEPFFNYSLDEYAAVGYERVFVTYDLYAGDLTDNIPTEYEIKKRETLPIKKAIIRLKKQKESVEERITAYIKEHLPRTVRAPKGDLPFPFTVPCEEGGFNNFYYWDTYFTNLALYRVGMEKQAKNNIENYVAMVEKYGYIPNADHLTDRSQPPLFAMAVSDYLSQTGDRESVRRWLAALRKELAFWERRKRQSGAYGYGGGEESDLSGFYEYVCGRVNTPVLRGELAKKQALGFMAIAESGWDFTYRFGRDFMATDYSAVDLTSLLYGAHRKTAEICLAVGESKQANFHTAKAEEILSALSTLKTENGEYRDKNEETGEFSPLFTVASLYPYAMGAETGEEKRREFMGRLKPLLTAHGVCVGVDRGQDNYLQWDYPMLWPPLCYFAYLGAKSVGCEQKAAEIVNKYKKTVEDEFMRTGKLWEKYSVLTGKTGASAEYQTPDMLGWTAGVYLFFAEERKRMNENHADHPRIRKKPKGPKVPKDKKNEKGNDA